MRSKILVDNMARSVATTTDKATPAQPGSASPRTDDPGLRELGVLDLAALEALAAAREPQAPRAWARLRVLIADERQRRTRMERQGLRKGGTHSTRSKHSEIAASSLSAADRTRAFTSIESALRDLRQVSVEYTTSGAQARALSRVLERLGRGRAWQ